MFMLVLITVLFTKYNFVFRMENVKVKQGMGNTDVFLPNIVNIIPSSLASKIVYTQSKFDIQEKFIDELRRGIELKNENKKEENLKRDFLYIDNNQDMLFQIYKYCNNREYFKEEDKELIEKLSNFVESGILLNEEVDNV